MVPMFCRRSPRICAAGNRASCVPAPTGWNESGATPRPIGTACRDRRGPRPAPRPLWTTHGSVTWCESGKGRAGGYQGDAQYDELHHCPICRPLGSDDRLIEKPEELSCESGLAHRASCGGAAPVFVGDEDRACIDVIHHQCMWRRSLGCRCRVRYRWDRVALLCRP
jgi:hypothetical protein